MRGMIGCAGMIAAVAFVFGLIGSLLATQANLGQRLMIALMPAVSTFVATLMLLFRDNARHASAMRGVRKVLLARTDVDDHVFLAHFPDADAKLITQTRLAIARFFDVPPQKLHANDRLRNDLQFGTLQIALVSFVVDHVQIARNVKPQAFTFNTAGLADIGDLVKETQRVIREIENPTTCSDSVR